MTETQLENKIAELEFWLTSNHNHADYSKVMSQKRDFERQLAELQRENKPFKY